METITYQITGMHYSPCERAVREELGHAALRTATSDAGYGAR